MRPESPLKKPKICSFPSLQENPPAVDSPLTIFLFPPLNNNFNVITWKNFIFSCNHCSYTIFVLTLYALYTLVMSVFILIDVQYSQNVVFSFENSSNGQNHSSSDSNHRIEKFLLAKFRHPLMLFWKPRVLRSRTYMLTRVFWHDLQHTTTPSKNGILSPRY